VSVEGKLLVGPAAGHSVMMCVYNRKALSNMLLMVVNYWFHFRCHSHDSWLDTAYGIQFYELFPTTRIKELEK